MANVKKFENPVNFLLRIESDVKKEIEKRSKNLNDFINDAIKDKLNKAKKGK